MSVEALIARFGLPALFVGAGVEGETVVVLGGVAAHHGLFGVGPAIAAAAAGSFVADQCFFLAGRRFRHHPRVARLMARPAFARAMTTFERHPTGFVFAFRFLYGLRTVSPLAIGTSAIPASRFLLLNACAAILWASIFVSLGTLFGNTIEAVLGRLVRGVEWVALAAGIGVAGWLIVRRFRHRAP
ncbi:DedA family protein [Sphingomonas sp. Y38-1Y]|uniref:DedA family protein n=1 Tax=Sphingomonas sp. Y38-1Y TaxID=3078265 RepID=UPI0028E1A695|nr:DedA family protein [Sphingomonas sp. Y38-1Y]